MKTLTPPYSLAMGGFWMTYCIAGGFAANYLLGLGYSNAQLGLILAAGNIAGSLLGTLLAGRIDRDRRLSPGRLLWPVLGVQAALLLLLVPQKSPGAAVSLAFGAYVAVMLSANSLLLKISADLTHRGTPVNYGFARGMGSLAYMLASVFLGRLLERTGVRIVPAAGLVFTAIQAAANVWLLRRTGAAAPREGPEPDGGAGRSLGAFLRDNRRFAVFLLGSVLVFYAFSTTAVFFINVVVNAGGNTETMGWLSAYMAALEIPVMMGFSLFRRRWSPSALLRFSFCMFAVKSLAVALARTVPALYAAYVFQPLSYAVYNPAVVVYVEQTVPFSDSAKGQSLAFSTTTVGAVLANLISGPLYDRLSVTATLLVAAGVCAVGAALCLGSIEKTALSPLPSGGPS